jgi:DNA topoisomerase I
MTLLQKKLEKIGRDPGQTARAAGLRYAPYRNKGYYRKKQGKGFFYTDENQQKITDPELLTRFNQLVIPPGWTNVWISPHENGHLQAIGTDSRGRRQYRYHAQWNKIRNQSKFFRLRNFASALPKIREQVEKDLARPGLCYEKVVALVVKLIELTNIRIGNQAYKKLYGSFGLTTLRDKHVQVIKNQVHFEFTGKKGVVHSISLQSRKLANLVKKCRDIPGHELFQYYDAEGSKKTLDSADVNQYLKDITGEDYTAKDFRAWAGTLNALCAFREAGDFSCASDCRKKIIQVIDTVAQKLGNTRSVCKKYYIDPTVISAYEKGTLARYKPREASPDLTPEEHALLELLQRESIAEVYT